MQQQGVQHRLRGLPRWAQALSAVVDRLLGIRGSIYEGDVFAALHQSPWIVRGFEFSLVDGAVDCSQGFDEGSSFAARFWSILQSQRVPAEAHDLLFFDVKSSTSYTAGTQGFPSSALQSRHAAFFIGICAGDPSFVELIPNHVQENLTDSDDTQAPQVRSAADQAITWVNSSRKLKLPAHTYRGLDPTGSPYRMPISYLPTAIERVRVAVRDGSHYVNPWTQVIFREWEPKVSRTMWPLMPEERSQNFSSYLKCMEIYRAVTFSPQRAPLQYDFVGLQPSLADFKLIDLSNGHSWAASPLELALSRRQYIIQHKNDPCPRLPEDRFERVSVARAISTSTDDQVRVHWYFTRDDRWDFLFYQFTVSDGASVFYFIPEAAIPDSFYASDAMEQSFDIPELSLFRVSMDPGFLWVDALLAIIAAHPSPRCGRRRPDRLLDRHGPMAMISREESSAIQQHLDDVGQIQPGTTGGGPDDGEGGEAADNRRGHEAVTALRHRQFYHEIMHICAARKSGLLSCLASGHPFGDFAFCRYSWTEEEQQDFARSGTTPRTLDTLAPETPVIGIHVTSRDIACDFHGPRLSPYFFRRLNSIEEQTLVLLDIYGTDTQDLPPLCIIPSEDFEPSDLQRGIFATNLSKTRAEHSVRTPFVQHLLRVPFLLADYLVSSSGPLIFEEKKSCSTWSFLLECLNTDEHLMHPAGHLRDVRSLRHPLHALHAKLAERLANSQREGFRRHAPRQ